MMPPPHPSYGMRWESVNRLRGGTNKIVLILNAAGAITERTAVVVRVGGAAAEAQEVGAVAIYRTAPVVAAAANVAEPASVVVAVPCNNKLQT